MPTRYQQYPVHTLGNYPINGVVSAICSTILYTDVTPKTLFILPDNATIINWIAEVKVAFNGNGQRIIHVGTDASEAKFADNVDVSVMGSIRAGFTLSEFGAVQSSVTTVKGYFTGVHDNTTTGEVLLICFFCIF